MSASKWAISLESAVYSSFLRVACCWVLNRLMDRTLALDFELNLAALDLVFLPALLGVFENFLHGSQFCFQPFPVGRQRFLLLAQRPDFLVTILEDEEGFEFGLHKDNGLSGIVNREKARNPGHLSATGVHISGNFLLSHNLEKHYHRGCGVSLPCSEWERVGPPR